MFVELASREFGLALPLAEQMDHCLAARSVARGMSPGTIHVDDPRDPRVALIRTGHRWHLIGGDPKDPRKRYDVGRLLAGINWTQAKQEGEEALVLYYAPCAWGACLADLLPAENPISGERRYLELETSRVLSGAPLPAGFRLREVTRELVEAGNLTGLDDLLEEMQSERASVGDFLDRSFGLIAVHGDALAGWCLSEYNADHRCEVGIATMRRFRRRGVATAMATAFVALARARDIARIGWHSWAHNAGSLATATKLGFREIKSFEVLLAFFDPVLDLAEQGDICLRRGEYRRAMEWSERVMAAGKAPFWVHWNAACAWAQLGDLGRALELANLAVDQGFCDADHAGRSEHLRPLHGTEGWRLFMARLAEAEQ